MSWEQLARRRRHGGTDRALHPVAIPHSVVCAVKCIRCGVWIVVRRSFQPPARREFYLASSSEWTTMDIGLSSDIVRERYSRLS